MDGSEQVIGPDGRTLINVGTPGVKYEYTRRCPNCFGAKMVRVQQERSLIPAVFYDATMNDFKWDIYTDDEGNAIDTTRQCDLVFEFLNGFKRFRKIPMGLYIWSKTRGCGKTFLASAICNELIEKHNCRPKFVSASSLIEFDKDEDPTRMRAVMDADVLVLDDLGQQNTGNKWLEDILFKILDQRLHSGKVTIVTSNARAKQLNFDDRISDRIDAVTFEVPMPDCCVRSRDIQIKKRELLAEMGLIDKDKRGNEEQGGQLRLAYGVQP